MVEVITRELLPGSAGRGILKRRLPRVAAFVLFLFLASFARIVCLAASGERSGVPTSWMKTVALHPLRGRIMDRKGTPLTVTPESFQLLSLTHKVNRLNFYARALEPVIDVPYDTLVRLLSSKKSVVLVKERLDPSSASRVEDMRLSGLFVRRERRNRLLHPAMRRQAQLVSLLENRYERVLAGRDGKIFSAPERRSSHQASDDFLRSEPVNGTDIIITLSGALQSEIRAALDAAVTSTGASRGMVMVLKACNGEIYAYVDATPGKRESAALFTLYRTDGLLDDYRLALDISGKGKGPALTRFEEEKERILNDTDHQASRALRLAARDEEREKAASTLPVEFLSNLGFGRPSGVDLPGEPRGVLVENGEARPSDVLATPLQIAASYASLINGRKSVRPHFLLGRGAGREDQSGAQRPGKGSEMSDALAKELEERGLDNVQELRGYSVGGRIVSCRAGAENHPCTAFLGGVSLKRAPWVILVILENADGTKAREAVRRLVERSAKELFRTERLVPDLDALSGEFLNTSLMKELKR